MHGGSLGVHTLIRKVCQRFIESCRDDANEDNLVLERGRNMKLCNRIEDAQRALTRIKDFRFSMYRFKRSQIETFETQPIKGRRIEPWDWDSEISRGYLDPSRHCIAMDFPDECVDGRQSVPSRSKPVLLPNSCGAHHHSKRVVQAPYQRDHGLQGLEQTFMSLSNCNVFL